MAIFYGLGYPNPPAEFVSRLKKMSKDERQIAETQLAQLITVRIFRNINKNLSMNQRIELQNLIHSKSSPKDMHLFLDKSIPNVNQIIHESIKGVFVDISI